MLKNHSQSPFSASIDGWLETYRKINVALGVCV